MAPTDAGVARGSEIELDAIALYHLYVWARSGAMDREPTASTASEDLRERIVWESSALARIAAAIEWFFSKYSSDYRASVQVHRGGFLRGGPDAAGVVMFSAYLEHQVCHWARLSTEGYRQREAAVRLAVHSAAHAQFHRGVGATADALAAASVRMNLDEDDRSGTYLRWHPDGTVDPGDAEKLLTRAEHEVKSQREMEAAKRARESAR